MRLSWRKLCCSLQQVRCLASHCCCECDGIQPCSVHAACMSCGPAHTQLQACALTQCSRLYILSGRYLSSDGGPGSAW